MSRLLGSIFVSLILFDMLVEGLGHHVEGVGMSKFFDLFQSFFLMIHIEVHVVLGIWLLFEGKLVLEIVLLGLKGMDLAVGSVNLVLEAMKFVQHVVLDLSFVDHFGAEIIDLVLHVAKSDSKE